MGGPSGRTSHFSREYLFIVDAQQLSLEDNGRKKINDRQFLVDLVVPWLLDNKILKDLLSAFVEVEGGMEVFNLFLVLNPFLHLQLFQKLGNGRKVLDLVVKGLHLGHPQLNPVHYL